MSLQPKEEQGIKASPAENKQKGRKRGATKKHPTIRNLPVKAIKMSAAGKTYREIAEKLGVSINTVSRYVRKKELETPSRKILEDLGIEMDGASIGLLNSIRALRATLSIYGIASRNPDVVQKLLGDIARGPDEFSALYSLVGIGLDWHHFAYLKGKQKLPPRPTRSLKGISEDDFFRIVQWASETPGLAQDVIARKHQSNGDKIELLLRFANEGTRHL